MSTRSGRASVWSPRSPNAWPEVTSRIMICQRLVRRGPSGRSLEISRISRSDPRVNGFEALHDCGCGEPLDAFLRTSSKAGAQVGIIQQPGHGLSELLFIGRGHKKAVFPVHDHIDYSASCGCDHRATTRPRLPHGRRTRLKAKPPEHGDKATTER